MCVGGFGLWGFGLAFFFVCVFVGIFFGSPHTQLLSSAHVLHELCDGFAFKQLIIRNLNVRVL